MRCPQSCAYFLSSGVPTSDITCLDVLITFFFLENLSSSNGEGFSPSLDLINLIDTLDRFKSDQRLPPYISPSYYVSPGLVEMQSDMSNVLH